MLTLCLGAPSSLTPLINDSCFTTVANRQLSTGADGFDRAPTQESWRLSQTEPYIPSHLRSPVYTSGKMGVLPSSLDVLDLRLDGKAVRNSGLVTSLDSVCSARIICTGFDSAPRGPTLGQNQDPPPSCRILPVESMLAVGVELFLCSSSSVPFSIFVSSFFFPFFFRQTWEMFTQGGRGLF